MADRWITYPFEFRGGLITNLSPLQHGIQLPGSARILRNFEPSIEGGYRRIEGFDKYDSSIVPAYGDAKVHGSGQTGSTLIIGNLMFSPVETDTFTIAGVAGTYTIGTGGVSYNSATKRATLTLTTSLASSPVDKAAITFTSGTGTIQGVAAWTNKVIAARNNSLYRSTGSGWTKISNPAYGTVLVNGAGQTGSSLVVDGLTGKPKTGDTFSIAGVALIYTVTADATVTSGGATLAISPALASSPADNAAITFLSASRDAATKYRFEKYRISTTEKVCGVDSINVPFLYDGTSFVELHDAPADVVGAEHVVWFKNQLFFAKGDKLTFTSPFTDSDFNPANGSGVISVGNAITGLIVFREQLIIFSQQKISRLLGNTLSDFVLQPITLNLGCIDTDTIQEIGSDIMFLGPDGLRLLGATDKVGDFSIAVVSKPIQSEMTAITKASTSFSSVVIREKSQYRIFGYNNEITTQNAVGVLGTQTLGDQTGQIAWAELRGIKSFVADSNYFGRVETVVFSNTDGFVYEMEQGNSFNGSNIIATFSTPFVPMEDPRIRKAFYKLFLYTDPTGSVTTSVNLKLDFDDEGLIQPDTIVLSNQTGAVGFYGSSSATYGDVLYGTKLKKLFQTQVIGSGFTVSLQFVSESTDPAFSLDAATLEYATYDRR
jgi:hypothetical protein